jgi:hypothetical protein
MMKRVPFAIAVFAVGFAVAGCGHLSGGEKAGDENVGSEEALVRYHMTGGLAGLDVRVVVFNDGSTQVISSRNPAQRFVIKPAALAKLRSTLAAGRWDEDLADDIGVVDGYGYEIVYGGRTVTASDPRVPAWVTEIASQLNALAFPVHADVPIPLPQ